MPATFQNLAAQIMGKYNMPQQAPQATMPNARQGLIGPTMLPAAMAGRPAGTATGMGMTPPSMGVFNPMLSQLSKAGMGGTGGGLPFARQKADGIMRKYGLQGAM